jgi:hypothetical protein
MYFSTSGGREVTTIQDEYLECIVNEQLNISLQVHFMKDLSDLLIYFRLWSSLKKIYGRHHELVNGYRVSVPAPLEGGRYTVLPLFVRSSQDVHNIFLGNCLWQQSDI